VNLADIIKRFNAGHLEEAIAAAKGAVQSKPQDAEARLLLVEFFCCAGEFERADRQLETLISMHTDMALPCGQMRSLIRSEVARQDFYEAGRTPEFLIEPPESTRERLRGVVLWREGDFDAATAAFESSDAKLPPLMGKINDQPFEAIRDGDDLLGPVLEGLSADGRYFWLPFEQIQELSFSTPERPRDLVFRTAELSLTSGITARVFIPVVYAPFPPEDRTELRLGRVTEWDESNSAIVRGLGQRVFLTPDADYGLMEIKTLSFDQPDAAGPSADAGE
jgi:type VI secretion system protein ImpE